ncbi:hypothetical protein AB0O34_32645 [Sphaerisporangium sp. NPDC088356]|uniref:hypothetical protein n=1 Tax=Sphaerisporangium sp. NPDC088356 TaxID=3154871 RepID=UPI003432E6AE
MIEIACTSLDETATPASDISEHPRAYCLLGHVLIPTINDLHRGPRRGAWSDFEAHKSTLDALSTVTYRSIAAGHGGEQCSVLIEEFSELRND